MDETTDAPPVQQGDADAAASESEENKLGMNADWSSSDDDEDYEAQPHTAQSDRADSDYPFHDAICNKDVDAFKSLLATRQEKMEKVKQALMQSDATVVDQDDPLSEKDEEGLTPLHYAILERNLDFVNLCLEAGCDISVRCQKVTVLHLVLSVGSIHENLDFVSVVFKLILSRAVVPLSATDDLQRTCLHLAAEFGMTECCTYILEQPNAHEIINEKDVGGRTALHVACQVSCAEVVDLLIGKGAKTSILDHEACSPLHIAVRSGAVECVDSLLPETSQETLQQNDVSGCTALDYAVRCQNAIIANKIGGDTNMEAADTPTRRRTLILTHDVCMKHFTCPPELVKSRDYSEIPSENPNRIKVLVEDGLGILRSFRLSRAVDWDEPTEVGISDILRVHEYPYIRKLQDLSARLEDDQLAELDSDTTVSKLSWTAAKLAAGSVCNAIDDVCGTKKHRNAFCAVRPPGHHAGPRGVVTCENDPAGSYGFCLLSNAAIGAAYARNLYRKSGIAKVAIIDFDVHHGNGTEACVKNLNPTTETTNLHPSFCDIKLNTLNYKPWLNENDAKETFFASIHGYGKRVPGFDPDPKKPPHIGNFYPSSGENYGFGEYGKRSENEPYILNFGQNSRQRMEWKRVWRDGILPALVEFNPDLIIISAGFDAHKRDEINMGYISVIEPDYAWLSRQLVLIANLCCDGRIVSVLEGGYAIKGGVISPFARSVCEHVASLVETSEGEKYDSKMVELEREVERDVLERMRQREEALKNDAKNQEQSENQNETEGEKDNEENNTDAEPQNKKMKLSDD